MRSLLRASLVVTPVALVATTSGYATTYLTLEQAQATMCAGESLELAAITLTPDQRRAVEGASGVRVRQPRLQAWRIASGGWFLVDEVLGKHEFITYAVRLSAAGVVQQVEILEYRETYGGQIRNEAWRSQFRGRTSHSPLKLDQDIKNISGATLSCRSVTDGIKRLLATHDLVLAHR